MDSAEGDDIFGEDMDNNDNVMDISQHDELNFVDEAEDERRIAMLLNPTSGIEGENEGIDAFLKEGPIDQTGKADDAIDYEDLSDDDLPDEEPGVATSIDGPGLVEGDDGMEYEIEDDLFGENEEGGLATSNIYTETDNPTQNGNQSDSFQNPLTLPSPPEQPFQAFRDVNFDPPPAGASDKELSEDDRTQKAKVACPHFERGVNPFPNLWFPSKQGKIIRKTAAKPPKPLNHSKLGLEIAPDHERAFRNPGPLITSNRAQLLEEAAARGIILDLEPDEEVAEKDAFEYTIMDEDTIMPSGHTLSTIRALFCDFSPLRELPAAEPAEADEWMMEFGGPSKKQKLLNFPAIDEPYYPVPSFLNFEELTAQIGSKVIYDLSDPHLLLAPVEPQSSNKRLADGNLKYGATAKKGLSRYNISNDVSNEALRKVTTTRSAADADSLEHSLPAEKLIYPYYKVKRQVAELRSFHRPPMKFQKPLNANIVFTKSTFKKRKAVKGKSPKELYAVSSDLSLSDNSRAILFEYSEEFPTVLSNFGMANRLNNYYRKKDETDEYRRKLDVGETQVLGPADESPFNKFGTVEPGETQPALVNKMYRAPVFEHKPRPHDFLVVRSTTGVEGPKWHLRIIDNVFAVGQELPLKDVPSPHSRMVTTLGKNRMKMIAERIIKHDPNHSLKVGHITSHIEDSTDLQNRQKLKEFMVYDKVTKTWRKAGDEPILAEAEIRKKIEPEDTCLVDAMHVGVRQLEDAGFLSAQTAGEDDDPTNSLEQRLAPWYTTSAFTQASAGRAMLELIGDGDPSGCGMAVSMIKTSMKGGFLKSLNGPLGTSADAMERQRKANGGHDYNVHEQEAEYSRVLGEIWNTQKAVLSDPVEHTENDEQDYGQVASDRIKDQAAAHAALISTPGDDTASTTSEAAKVIRNLIIKRKIRLPNGGSMIMEEIVKDPIIAKKYAQRRAARDSAEIDIYSTETTGDPDADKNKQLRAKQELLRLQRNKERREHRERMKAKKNAVDNELNSPTPATPAPSDVGAGGGETRIGKGKKPKTQPGTTPRKCAGCGASGHIKTNRKLCPMLNGEWPDGIQPFGWTPAGSSQNDNGNATGVAAMNGVADARAAVADETAPMAPGDESAYGNGIDMDTSIDFSGVDAASPGFEL